MTITAFSPARRPTDPRQSAMDGAGAHLFALEDHLDAAFASAAQFAANLPSLRRDAGLAATVGQEVYSASARMSGHLAAAREEGVRIHNRLEKIRRDHAFGELTLPPDGDKPPHFAASGTAEPA